MRNFLFVTLLALAAAPGMASVERRGALLTTGNPVDWLYPEIPVDDESWRGLLPVILLDPDEVAEQPAPKTERSERP